MIMTQAHGDNARLAKYVINTRYSPQSCSPDERLTRFAELNLLALGRKITFNQTNGGGLSGAGCPFKRNIQG